MFDIVRCRFGPSQAHDAVRAVAPDATHRKGGSSDVPLRKIRGMLRVAIAMVAAPVVVWALLFSLALALHPDPAGSGLILVGPFIGLYLVAIAGMVGVPLVIVLRRYGRAGFWPYVIAGAFTGLAMLLLMGAGWRGLAASARSMPVAPLGFAIVGAAIGAVFWWMGIRRNAWFASGESWLEAAAVRAAAAADANSHEGGRAVGRTLLTMRRRLAPVIERVRSWQARPGKRPVLSVASVLIPAGTALVWVGVQHADLRSLGYAAMLVYLLMIVLIRGGVIAGICLAVAALVRRERFWPLAVTGLLANLAVAMRFSST